MSDAKAAKKKQSFWQTLREASGPYRRLLGYIKPYKTRFIVGLLLGFAYGGVSALLPLAISRVTGTIFHAKSGLDCRLVASETDSSARTGSPAGYVRQPRSGPARNRLSQAVAPAQLTPPA